MGHWYRQIDDIRFINCTFAKQLINPGTYSPRSTLWIYPVNFTLTCTNEQPTDDWDYITTFYDIRNYTKAGKLITTQVDKADILPCPQIKGLELH